MSLTISDVTIEPGTSPIDVTGSSISVSNFPAIQPVSGTVAVSSISSPVAVTGTFWQTTQPVSLASTTITGSVAVTGTFWQATQPISGSVTVSNFPATQPVSGTVTANAGTGNFTVVQSTGTNLHVVVDSGTVTTSAGTSNSATITQVTSTGSNQTLLAANASRKKAIIFVASGNCYIKFGATASASSFTYNVTSNNTTIEVLVWTGQIDILQSTSGKLVTVTEMV